MMYKIIFLLIYISIFSSITWADIWLPLKEGITSPAPAKIEVLKDDDLGITLQTEIFGVNVEEKEDGKFKLLSIPNEYYFTKETGKPKLPFIQTLLAIPDGVDIDLKILSSDSLILSPYLIYPVPNQVLKTTPEGYSYIAEEFCIDDEFYQQDTWYPNSQKTIPPITSTITYIRDQRLLRLEIYPIQFNPAKKQLNLYTNLKIEINYIRKKSLPISLKQTKMAEPFDRGLKKAVLNYKPAINIKSPAQFATKRIGTVSYITNLKNPSNSCDYLIITSEPFYNNEDIRRLAEHRAEYNSFDVAVVNTTSIYNEFPVTEKGSTTSIKEFIRYVYYNWSAPSMADNHLGYILLFGDGEEKYPSYVPPKILNEIYSYPGVADTWYICINDENLSCDYWTMDIMIARLPIETGTDAKTMVDKIIEYEKNPQIGQWRNKVLLADGKDYGGDFDPLIDHYFLPAGFEVTKIEETGTGGMVVKAINDGHLLVIYNGHGNPLGWAMSMASPFTTRQVEELFNSNKLPVVFSAACDTADILWDDRKFPDCIAEAFLKKENGGAIAYWGASAFTNAGIIHSIKASQYMAEITPNSFSLGELTLNSYNYLWQHEWIMLGDPALTISRTGVEQNKAELEIEPIDISFAPQSPKTSENTKISATVHNLGDKDADNVLVKFFLGDPEDNGVEIGSKTITLIPTEGTGTTEINWISDVPIGKYKIYVVIDPYDTIPEAGTINNTAYKPIEINIYQKGWYQSHPQSPRIDQSLAVGDINEDEDLEVVGVVTGNYVYIWHHNGEFVNGWPKLITVDGEGDIAGTPILADIDNDNELEIIISGRKRFYVLNYDGSDVPGFPKEGTNSASPAIGDIDNDGNLEIVVEMSGKLYAWHYDGTLVVGNWPISLQGYRPIMADVNKDGNLEIIVFTGGQVYVFNCAGNLIPGQWPKTIPGEVFSNGYAVGNIDTDDELEILIASYQEPKIILYALNYDGSDVAGYPKQIGGETSDVPYSVILGDIDNDENIEMIIDCRKYLYVLNHDGNNVFGWPKAGIQRGPSNALLSDMDNDKHLEIIESECTMNNNKGTITIWNNDGSLKGNLFMKPGDERTSPFVIADIDLDGDVEVICAGEEFMHIAWALPKVYIWDYEGKCSKGALEWPMANHDARRTNCYNTDIICPAKIINLEAKNPTLNSVDLTWTATGDDYDVGSATLYYIRYATFTITPQNWHLTNKATCTITPKIAGSQENFTVTGLQPNTAYYFCLRARDDEFNTSPLSNNAPATTTPQILTSIEIIPYAIILTPAATFTFRAKAKDQFGQDIPDVSFNWTTTIGTINATMGSITGFTAPEPLITGTITAGTGSIMASAMIIIRPKANIKLEPEITYTRRGGTFTINIIVCNVLNLLGAKLKLSYNPGKIMADNIIEGETFLGKNGGNPYFATKQINNTTGSVTIEFVLLGGTPTGVSGTGTVCSLNFTAVANNPAGTITFEEVDLREVSLLSLPLGDKKPAIIKNRLLGDFGQKGSEEPDNIIDFEDLVFFASYWNAQNPKGDIASTRTTGTAPDFTYEPDGKVDFEDLVIFAAMWNWYNQSGKGRVPRGEWKTPPTDHSPLTTAIVRLKTVKADENEVCVDVVVENVTDFLAGHFILEFDADKWELATTLPFMDKGEPGQVGINIADMDGKITAGGNIVRLTFHPKSPISNPQFAIRNSQFTIFLISVDLRDTQTNAIPSYIVPILTYPQDLTKAYCYPNPYLPSQHTQGITFAELTEDVRIRIFTIAGELVYDSGMIDLVAKGTDKHTWHPKNLASGIYIYLIINNQGQKKTGKLGVIR